MTPNYTLGAVAVIRDGDRRVMLLRTRQHNGWSLPGGLLRRGEDPLDGLARELAEEIDIEIAPATLVNLPQHTLIEPGTQQVTVVVELELTASPAPDGVEVLEIGWFALDDIPSQIVRQTFDLLRVAGINIPTGR